MNIILPVAGKSSRFPNVRPKWLLTNPTGNLMVVDSIISLGIENITSLNLVYLKEHESVFKFKRGLVDNLKLYGLDSKVNFIELDTETKNQVETVRMALKAINTDVSFLIKDSDNRFSVGNHVPFDTNFVMYYRLSDLKYVDASSKSYIEIDNMGVITNVVEKKIVSDKFCCGGYYFTSSDEFLKYSDIPSDTLFISDVIFNMLLNGKTFVGVAGESYEDWGTIDDWHRYKNTFKTLFVDIDGVIFQNSSAYVEPYIGETSIIVENVNYLKQMVKTDRIQLILTTARPESYRELTETQLKQIGLGYNHLIMGLNHCQRILVNDFSNTNPYPSCSAINLERNSNQLEKYL